VLLLLDGKRTPADLARLTQHSEHDVAYTLARFMQWGYIEPVHAEEDRTSRFENGYGSA
jgi:DNA-binding MarR family transcriptional regulator